MDNFPGITSNFPWFSRAFVNSEDDKVITLSSYDPFSVIWNKRSSCQSVKLWVTVIKRLRKRWYRGLPTQLKMKTKRRINKKKYLMIRLQLHVYCFVHWKMFQNKKKKKHIYRKRRITDKLQIIIIIIKVIVK